MNCFDKKPESYIKNHKPAISFSKWKAYCEWPVSGPRDTALDLNLPLLRDCMLPAVFPYNKQNRNPLYIGSAAINEDGFPCYSIRGRRAAYYLGA
eukprot:scaffold182787_cov20-Prasinocladus_malaysianus.AAC.1